MAKYIDYDELMFGDSPCEDIECDKCSFDNGSGVACKLYAWINNLEQYEPQMVRLPKADMRGEE